jgi:hypothetical protein
MGATAERNSIPRVSHYAMVKRLRETGHER